MLPLIFQKDLGKDNLKTKVMVAIRENAVTLVDHTKLISGLPVDAHEKARHRTQAAEIFWLEAIPGNLEIPEATALTKTFPWRATSLHKVLKRSFSPIPGEEDFSPEAFRSRLDWRQL